MALFLRGVTRYPAGIGKNRLQDTRLFAKWERFCSSSGSSDSDSSGSDTNQPVDKPTLQSTAEEQKRNEAKRKLNALLESLQKPADGGRAEGGVSERLARPGRQPRPAAALHRAQRGGGGAGRPSLEQQVTAAARTVAAALDGDGKQTELQLLHKLSGAHTSHRRPLLSDLVSGMRVEPPTPAGEDTAAPPTRHIRQQLGPRRSRLDGSVSQAGRDRQLSGSDLHIELVTVNLYEAQPLEIFTDTKEAETTAEEEPPPAGLWERLFARELRLTVTRPPANAWQEMVLWTEQGKLWRLPVDNEQGLEEDASVGFHEHVFLEPRLEPWCPPRGPIRHFMELVCIALGKNPWLSVEEKHEHIEWFRDYFEEKRPLLQELKAL